MVRDIKKLYAYQTLKILVGGILGYCFFWLTSHPTKSPLQRKIPQKQFKNVSYLPELKIRRHDKEYHLHHWMNLSVLYVLLLFVRKGYFKSYMLRAFLLGSILQGLLYQDRFKVIDKIVPVSLVESVDEK